MKNKEMFPLMFRARAKKERERGTSTLSVFAFNETPCIFPANSQLFGERAPRGTNAQKDSFFASWVACVRFALSFANGEALRKRN